MKTVFAGYRKYAGMPAQDYIGTYSFALGGVLVVLAFVVSWHDGGSSCRGMMIGAAGGSDRASGGGGGVVAFFFCCWCNCRAAAGRARVIREGIGDDHDDNVNTLNDKSH